MRAARKQAYLILIGAAIIGLCIVVHIRNRSVDLHLLAAAGILGGLAVVVNSLPVANGNGNGKEKHGI